MTDEDSGPTEEEGTKVKGKTELKKVFSRKQAKAKSPLMLTKVGAGGRHGSTGGVDLGPLFLGNECKQEGLVSV